MNIQAQAGDIKEYTSDLLLYGFDIINGSSLFNVGSIAKR